VQRALDSLTRRCLIATRQGAGHRASTYLLNFTTTARFGSGPTVGPLAQTTLQFQDPQRPYSNATSQAKTTLDIDKYDSILDRVLKARPNHFQASQLSQVRSYAYKWLIMQRGQANAQAPDAQVCARIATAAGGVSTACDWIRDHLEDRQAETCEYLVTWMLQKIHGYAPAAAKRRRAELRAIAGGSQAPAEPADTAAILRTAVTQVKGIR